MPRRQLAEPRTLATLLISTGLLAGLWLGRDVQVWHYWLAASPVAVLLLTSVQRRVLLVGVYCVGLSLGYVRGKTAFVPVSALQAYYGQNIEVQVVALEDGVYGTGSQMTFRGQASGLLAPRSAEVGGVIRVGGFGALAIFKGDQVRVSGKLYRARGSAIASIQFAKLEVTATNQGALDKFRLKFSAGLRAALPEPEGSFALGLLVGQRSGLPDALQDQLSTIGLVHIIAVSGYNLTVLVDGSRKIFGRLSQYQGVVFSVVLIGLFLLITGLSAPIVRAAMVSMLSIGAAFYGRRMQPLSVLLLSAALSAWARPSYVWFDTGWYLSIAAFAGILLVSPLLTQLFWRRKKPKLIGGTIVETIAAQATTTPMLLWMFGRFTMLSLVANMLVVPFVPLAMACCALAGLAGMTGWPILIGILGLPARILLGYMLHVSELLARQADPNQSFLITGSSMALAYALLAIVVYAGWRMLRVGRTIKAWEL